MATRGQLFPSRFLKADPDFLKKSGVGFREATLTIRTVVESEEVAPNEKDPRRRNKPVIYFTGVEKGMPINGTIFNQIAGISGVENTEGWGGVRVRAYVTDVQNPQGGQSKVIRFREVDDGGDAAATVSALTAEDQPAPREPVVVTAGAPTTANLDTFDPDEIPF